MYFANIKHNLSMDGSKSLAEITVVAKDNSNRLDLFSRNYKCN